MVTQTYDCRVKTLETLMTFLIYDEFLPQTRSISAPVGYAYSSYGFQIDTLLRRFIHIGSKLCDKFSRVETPQAALSARIPGKNIVGPKTPICTFDDTGFSIRKRKSK